MISFGRWQFDFSESLIIGVSLLLLVSMLLSFRFILKRLFKRAPWRAVTIMLLNAIAYVAVFLLLLEPRFSQQVQQRVTLVTEGAEFASASRVPSAGLYVAPGVPVSSTLKQDFPNANWLLDIEQLPLREPALSAIEVYGFGLEVEQWLNLPQTLKVEFEPPDIDGFTDMRWPRTLIEGETLLVSGHYQTINKDGIIQLHLLDPADNVVDEARIKSGQAFTLTARIKTPGNLAYKLQAWNAELMLSEQLVPVEVGQASPLDILIIQSAPSFETRALKNYAAAQGHRVRLNSDISKGKRITQIANLDNETDTNLSPQILAEHDVLIMDGRALVNLPPTQRQWLNAAVDGGLGLLVLADSTLANNIRNLNADLLSGFQLAPSAKVETTAVPRLLTVNATDWQEPLPVAGMQLSAENADVLIDDGQGRSLVISRSKGLGKIGISLISHTHSWLTAGQNTLWGDYWRTLFSSLARQQVNSYLLALPETEFSRVNQRLAVCALGTENGSSVLIRPMVPMELSGGFELQLAADRMNSPRQCAYFWPRTNGWHQLQLYSANRASVVLDQKAIYVFDTTQWLAQHRNERLRATLARSNNSRNQPTETAATSVSEPLSPFWLWLALIFSASCLWLERKLDVTFSA
jgi:hypothetical protein